MATVTIEDVEAGQTVIVTVIQDSDFIDDDPGEAAPEDEESPVVLAIAK